MSDPAVSPITFAPPSRFLSWITALFVNAPIHAVLTLVIGFLVMIPFGGKMERIEEIEKVELIAAEPPEDLSFVDNKFVTLYQSFLISQKVLESAIHALVPEASDEELAQQAVDFISSPQVAQVKNYQFMTPRLLFFITIISIFVLVVTLILWPLWLLRRLKRSQGSYQNAWAHIRRKMVFLNFLGLGIHSFALLCLMYGFGYFDNGKESSSKAIATLMHTLEKDPPQSKKSTLAAVNRAEILLLDKRSFGEGKRDPAPLIDFIEKLAPLVPQDAQGVLEKRRATYTRGLYTANEITRMIRRVRLELVPLYMCVPIIDCLIIAVVLMTMRKKSIEKQCNKGQR